MYTHIREEIARSILLGLEIFIAVDIIKTVTTDLTLISVLTLGLIIIIRMLLSVSLEWEIEKIPMAKIKFPNGNFLVQNFGNTLRNIYHISKNADFIDVIVQ